MSKKLKTVQFSPRTETHDLAYRFKAIREFLTKGHPVRLSVRFRGREVVHPEIGHDLLAKVIDYVKDVGIPNKPSMNGRDLIVTVNPK